MHIQPKLHLPLPPRFPLSTIIGLHKIFVYFKACVHERIIDLLPLPIRMAHPGATSYCTPIAQNTPRHRPSLYMPYTIRHGA